MRKIYFAIMIAMMVSCKSQSKTAKLSADSQDKSNIESCKKESAIPELCDFDLASSKSLGKRGKTPVVDKLFSEENQMVSYNDPNATDPFSQNAGDTPQMALGVDPFAVIAEGRMVTWVGSMYQSLPVSDPSVQWLIRNPAFSKIQVAKNVYAVYTTNLVAAETAAGTSTATATATAGATVGTVVASGVAIAGAVVLAYMVYDYNAQFSKVNEQTKDMTKEEKDKLLYTGNTYWDNFCSIYSWVCFN